jgi:hypothetical protein
MSVFASSSAGLALAANHAVGPQQRFGRELDVVAVDSHKQARLRSRRRRQLPPALPQRRGSARTPAAPRWARAGGARPGAAPGGGARRRPPARRRGAARLRKLDHGQRRRAGRSHVTRCDATSLPHAAGAAENMSRCSRPRESRRWIASSVLASMTRARGAPQVPDGVEDHHACAAREQLERAAVRCLRWLLLLLLRCCCRCRCCCRSGGRG